MSINGSGEITSEPNRGRPDGGFLGVLRGAALVAVLVGGVGSLALMLGEGQQTPRFLLVLFVIWILSPFVALAWDAKFLNPRVLRNASKEYEDGSTPYL